MPLQSQISLQSWSIAAERYRSFPPTRNKNVGTWRSLRFVIHEHSYPRVIAAVMARSGESCPRRFYPCEEAERKGGGKEERKKEREVSPRQLSLVAVVAGVSRPVSGGIRFLSRWTGSRSRPIRSSAAEKIMCLSLPVRASIK